MHFIEHLAITLSPPLEITIARLPGRSWREWRKSCAAAVAIEGVEDRWTLGTTHRTPASVADR
uniref:Uncharacterized protein n=1 Tax=Oryza meridionalis TaxID=40149 RepID=A0A0E0EN93_9ORYZ